MQSSYLNQVSSNQLVNRLRSHFMADFGIQNQLDYGRAILETPEQLAQYWFCYGLMVPNQWEVLLEQAKALPIQPQKTVRVFDYGCGQGIGSLMLLDHPLLGQWAQELEQITLVEPSVLALARAQELIAGASDEKVAIKEINRKLDDLFEHDIVCSEQGLNVHVFSNILDVPTFDEYALVNRILNQPGEHVFLAASHDRDFGGGKRVPELYNALVQLDDTTTSADYDLHYAHFHRFTTRRGQPAACFVLHFHVGA